MKEVKVTKLNSNKPEEWLEFVNIGLKVFGKQFYTFIAMCDGDYKKLKDVEIKGNKLIDDVLFLEVDGKRVGAAMLAKQHSLMEEVEPRKKTLFLHYLMVLDGKIVVMEEDKKTIYLTTDIYADALSDSLKQELISGKFIYNIDELYGFLESYTS